MAKTAARHFQVGFLSNLYTIRICMRNFFRASSQDYCHMQTSDAACLCFVRTFSVLIGRHRPNLFSDPIDRRTPRRLLAAFVVSAFVGDFRRCRLPASLQESHLTCSGSIDLFPSAFSALQRLPQRYLRRHRLSQSRLHRGSPFLFPPSAASAVIFRTFSDLDPPTLILDRLCHLPNLFLP
jgi:hypothetical protein